MPTSAGKTKSIEIIIRSSFLAQRSKVAIVVAPFRALCAEIRFNLTEAFAGEGIDVDSPSDTFQVDFEEEISENQNNLVLVVTPEKLIYMLRHAPELADSIGLLIYDEAHQFDTGDRGITYELLLSTLKRIVPGNIQTILISAVLSNAQEIGTWIAKGCEVVSGSYLHPTYRTVAFTTWTSILGQLQFVNLLNPEQQEYFVPRVLEQIPLEKKGRETKQRYFPTKSEGNEIALYLGIKLVSNGGVAIFCGTKATVSSICDNVVDIFRRNYVTNFPSSFSDQIEQKKLKLLLSQHFGSNSTATICSDLGVYAHSGNTPQGLRLAIEFAMQKGLIKFVICTSTLAQGVNLPIKYLIVTSIYQGQQPIATRDFHNLIGRAGRSGIHTEGSIIFADPEIYDRKTNAQLIYKWRGVKRLLNPETARPCVSSILRLFEPLKSDDNQFILNVGPLDYIQLYIDADGNIPKVAFIIAQRYARLGFAAGNLALQIEERLNTFAAIESYLMANSSNQENLQEEEIESLAESTLAFHSSADTVRVQIVKLFKAIANNVSKSFPIAAKRQRYGKALFGVRDMQIIEKWVFENITSLMLAESDEEILKVCWPILLVQLTNSTFRNVEPQVNLLVLATDWLAGHSYYLIHENQIKLKSVVRAKTQKRTFTIEKTIDLCDGAFGFEAMLVIGAIREVTDVNFNTTEVAQLTTILNRFQKKFKYGVISELAVIFYELGFADREICQQLAAIKPYPKKSRRAVIQALFENSDYAKLLQSYPSYFMQVLEEAKAR